MGGHCRVAHHEPPSAAELRIYVTVWCDPVVEQRLDQCINAMSCLHRIKRIFAMACLEARMVDDKVHVGVELRGAPDICTATVLLGEPREEEPFVDADGAYI